MGAPGKAMKERLEFRKASPDAYRVMAAAETHVRQSGLAIRGADGRLYLATTSIPGSIVRSRFSIPRSVPEIELGQVPHAPW